MSAVPSKKAFKNPNVRCTGKSVIRDDHNIPILDEDGARQFKPCLNWAANGTTLCGKHGGALEPTIAAAKRRLLHGSDDLVEILERIAKDENQTAADRIKAINSYLDRAGVRAGVDISLEAPRWQKMLGEMFGAGSSSEDERARDDEAADPGGVIRERVRKLNTREETPPDVAPAPPAEETKRAPRPRRKATPPEAKPKFEGW